MLAGLAELGAPLGAHVARREVLIVLTVLMELAVLVGPAVLLLLLALLLGNKSFLDSNPARFGLIKGYSPVESCAFIVALLWRAEATLAASTWFDRVPGPSNIADAASRLSFSVLVSMPNAVFYSPVLPSVRDGDFFPLHPMLRARILD